MSINTSAIQKTAAVVGQLLKEVWNQPLINYLGEMAKNCAIEDSPFQV